MAEPIGASVNPDADGLVGGCTLWASDSLPTAKYLFAEGQAVSREVYSLLFSRIGERYGVGDGSTTFNLPDLVDAVPRGGDGTVDTGTMGGTETATMPAHDHDISPNPHGHTYVNPFVNVVNLQAGATGISFPDGSTTSTGTTSLTTSTEGGGGDNWPPYVTMRWIIKVT
jgi:microcystin-dependent protein